LWDPAPTICATRSIGGWSSKFEAAEGNRAPRRAGARPAALTAKVDDATHLAGQLAIDDIVADGPKVTATFDVTLTKDFRIAR
jgi:hypothetical protein